MNKKIALLTLGTAMSSILLAQPTFTDQSTLLSNETNSGGCVGVTDMNGDGLDDIIKLHNSKELFIEYQQADGSFDLFDYGTVSGNSQWGMTIADTDNDGQLDVFSGGNFDGSRIVKIDDPGSGSIYPMPNSNLFVQGSNYADINNDGNIDVFSCNDVAESQIWENDGVGGFLNADSWIDMTTTPSSDNSGNYGTVWSDFDNDGDVDLLIAKCRQNVNDTLDPRRINALFVNDGNNNYTDEALARGFVLYSQSWTVELADIDNDGDMDMIVTNHDNTLKLLENDGAGYFTDITAGSGLEINGFFLQCVARDFDNDGWLDLLIAGGIHTLFMNNGNKTFTQYDNQFPHTDGMHSYGIGDLNMDGYPDVFASYGNGYVTPDYNNPDMIWMNDGGNNNWFSASLVGTVSNQSAVGARTELYGPWGVQIRDVRAGESYGIVNSFTESFGIGTSTTIDSMVVRWPSGMVDTYENLNVNEYITVIEGECVAPIATITPNGSTVLCMGETVDLSADAGYTYNWNTGETSQMITVDADGIYSVSIDDGNGCFGTTSIYVELVVEDLPDVALDNADTFCDGESITLTSSPAASYLWNTSDTSQSIVVTTSGMFNVTVPGLCNILQSMDVEITVMPTPAQPTANDQTIPVPGTASLTSTGTDLRWYDAASGGNEVGQGTPWETPFLDQDATFWVADANGTPGVISYSGMTDNTAGGQYHGNGDNWIEFNAIEPFILKSVKVYSDGAANRTIDLIDANENVLTTFTVLVPDGESRIILDFEVPIGAGMGLRLSGPTAELWRDNAGNGNGHPYPFDLDGMGEIYGATTGNPVQYYYFFYDWEIESLGSLCESPREDVDVTVSSWTGIDEVQGLNDLNIYPNPSSDVLNITIDLAEAMDARIELYDATGRLVYNKDLNNISGRTNELVNVNALSSGLYDLHVVLNGQIASRKVMLR